MISIIGLFLFVVGFSIINIFGTPHSRVNNKADDIGAAIIIASFVCLFYSIGVLCLKYLP